jgi:hypothetical protein
MSILGFITSVLGIVGFFCNIYWLMVMGAIVYAIETISGLITGELKSIATSVFTLIVSLVVSGATSYNMFYGVIL